MTLYHRSADMLERAASTLDEEMVRGCQQDIADMNALAAELRAAAALDELVRENERLGLYDDQKPNAHELPAMPQAFADYMTKQMPPDTVISDPQWWARRIWRTAMRLHAAPAPAQPRQPLSEWIACSEQMPILSEGDDELPVYTWDGESVKADEFGFLFEQPAGPAVGGWVCIGADFLNNLSGTVTHWMPRNMPAAPERVITGDKP